MIKPLAKVSPYNLITQWLVPIDINECETDNGGCEQGCVNQDGSFHCNCSDSYILSSNKLNCSRSSISTCECHISYLSYSFYNNMTTAEVQSTPFNSCESVSVFINNIVSSSFASVELRHQWQCHICYSASDNYYYNR